MQIHFPENISEGDEQYFEQCLQWDYTDPAIKTYSYVFVFRKGYTTTFWMHPIQNMAPWPAFYDKFKRSFFLGKVLTALSKKSLKIDLRRRYFYCINEFSDNFYHWFVEVLPKMTYITRYVQEDCRFFIPFSLSQYQQASLELGGFNFCCGENEVTLFSKLRVVENFTGSTGYYHPPLLKDTARFVKRAMATSKNAKRKVYVTRKSAARRTIINEEQLYPVLQQQGFEIFDFDQTGFDQQVKVISETSIIVSQHGAALTHMIFMPPGSAVVELLPRAVMSDKCYFILAGSMKHSYYYLFCDTDGESHITSNFLVNVKEFETVLTMAVSGKELTSP